MKLLELIKNLFCPPKPKFVSDKEYLEDVLQYITALNTSDLKGGDTLNNAFWKFNWYRSSKYCFHPKDSQILSIAFQNSHGVAAFMHSFASAAKLELSRILKEENAKLCK